MDYNFTLKFELENKETESEQYLDSLFEAGCDDALIGVGTPGSIALDFIRKSDSAYNAIVSAIKDVKRAIPNAKLIEASPDLVNPSDIASLIGHTRQNVRKMILSKKQPFPTAVHSSFSGSFWHLEQVLIWMKTSGYPIDDKLADVAHITLNANVARQGAFADKSIQQKFNSLIF